MKALIWILTFLFGTVLNILLGYATGIRAGAFLLYLLEYYIAKSLCEKWENRGKSKASSIAENRTSNREKQPIDERQTQNYVQIPEMNNKSEETFVDLISYESACDSIKEPVHQKSTIKAKRSFSGIIAIAVALALALLAYWYFVMKPADIDKLSSSVLYLELYDKEDNVIGSASGVPIDTNTVVTNYHVIVGAYKIIAYNAEGLAESEIISVLGYDETADLAVLHCEKSLSVQPLSLGNSDKVKQGDVIYAVGYPLGLSNTLSDGIVSSRYKDENDIDILQITAPISPGSSGGALFSEDGEVVGIICASYEAGQNINLAIASTNVAVLMNSANNETTLESVFLSNFPQGLLTITNDTGRELNLSIDNLQGVWKHIYSVPDENILVTISIDGNRIVELWEYADGSYMRWEGPAGINSNNQIIIRATTHVDYSATTGETKTDSWGETLVTDAITNLYENIMVTSFGEYYYRQ